MKTAKRVIAFSLLALLCLAVSFGSTAKLPESVNNTAAVSIETPKIPSDNAVASSVPAEKVEYDENGDRIVKKIVHVASPVTSVTTADALNQNADGSGATYEEYDPTKPLSPLAQIIYDASVPEIKKVYNGEIEYANTGLVDISDRMSVDVQSIRWDPTYKPTAVFAEADKIVADLIKEFSAGEEEAKAEAMTRLLCEYPNELFWFDKTKGMKSGHNYYIAEAWRYKDENDVEGTLEYYCIEQVFYLATFLVADEFKNEENPLTYCPYRETDEDGNQLVDENNIPFVPRYDDGSYDREHIYGWYCENVSIESIEKMRNAEAVANRVIEEAANLSDSEKLKYYHDYILNTITYNTDAAYRQETYGNAWQMLYVFDDDDTTNVVCEGYSKAFKYLCDHTNFNCDLKCIIVTGDLYQNGRHLGGHMWNNIIKDGVVLHCDLTNDDNDSGDKRPLFGLFEAQPKAVKNSHCYYSQGNSTIHYVLDTEITRLYKDEVINLEPVFSIGDVNMDGETNMMDAVKVAMGEKQGLSFLEEILADIDNNGVVDRDDALVISEQ